MIEATQLLRAAIMPMLPLLLWLLPFKVAARQLKLLALSFWLAGGIVLTAQGFSYLERLVVTQQATFAALALPLIVALAVGLAKGRFVLSKTSQRNLARLDAMPDTYKLVHVYSRRSWIMIGLMVLISITLTLTETPWFWRGLINVAIGFALVVSAQAYVRALSQPVETSV
jgi:hypothetical protein